MQPHEKKTAIYCRVAHADQLSLDAQKEYLRRYAKDNGYCNFEFYLDNGYSGISYDRPALSRLEDDIRAGFVEAVIVRDQSRIGRNVFITAQWIDRVISGGIALVAADCSINENILRFLCHHKTN